MKRRDAKLAVAASAVLVGNVPHVKGWVRVVTFGKLRVDESNFVAIDR